MALAIMQPNYKRVRDQRFALTHNWNLVLPTDLLTAIFSVGGLLDNSFSNALSSNIKCTSMTIPETNVKTETAKVYGIKTTQIVEAEQTNSISLTLLEDERHVQYNLFSIWRDLGMNPKSYSHLMRKWISMPRFVFLQLLSSKRGLLPPLQFELFDVQPTNVKLSQPTNDPAFQTCTVELKFSGYETLWQPIIV